MSGRNDLFNRLGPVWSNWFPLELIPGVVPSVCFWYAGHKLWCVPLVLACLVVGFHVYQRFVVRRTAFLWGWHFDPLSVFFYEHHRIHELSRDVRSLAATDSTGTHVTSTFPSPEGNIRYVTFLQPTKAVSHRHTMVSFTPVHNCELTDGMLTTRDPQYLGFAKVVYTKND